MIDFHTHPVMIRELVEKDSRLATAVRDVFGLYFPPQPLEIFIREMDAAGVSQAVLLPIDCTTAHGYPIVSNDQVAGLVRASERFIGFASVDPLVPGAGAELVRAVKDLGLRGLKLDPALQRFSPRSRRHAFPLFEIACDLDIPVMVHCGISLAKKGSLAFASPLVLGDALEHFPSLKLVIPHLGWPYVDEAVMLAIKYPNVFLDTSILYGGAPADTLRHVLSVRIGYHVVESSLQFKLLFGSNYPRIDIRRSARAASELELSPATRDGLLRSNAEKLLRLRRTEE